MLIEFGVPFIVAVKMESHQIGEHIVVPVPVNVVELYSVSVLKGQFAPSAFPLLLLEQLSELLFEHRVVFEPLAPIEEVPVVWACSSLHLSMPLDMCLTVRSDFCAFGGCEYPCPAFICPPVFLHYPVHALVGVSPF